MSEFQAYNMCRNSFMKSTQKALLHQMYDYIALPNMLLCFYDVEITTLYTHVGYPQSSYTLHVLQC
jgi:hypothetical protein